jgi:hypothetical protein
MIMMRIPTLFTVCFYVATAHLPMHAMDDAPHGGSIQNDYTNDPDYVFAKRFLQFIGKKINESENGSIPLDANGADYMLNHLRAVEGYYYSLKPEALTEWLSQLSQEKLDSTTKEHIKKRIHQILSREPFTDEQAQTILIAFLDTYDDNFKALDYQQKQSFSWHSLVLRLMEICKAPASISQRLGMAFFGSRYPLSLGNTIVVEIAVLAGSYAVGFAFAMPIVILSGGSFSAIMGYPAIGSFTSTGIYNGINWFRFKREENRLRDAINTAPVGNVEEEDEVLLEERDD